MLHCADTSSNNCAKFETAVCVPFLHDMLMCNEADHEHGMSCFWLKGSNGLAIKRLAECEFFCVLATVISQSQGMFRSCGFRTFQCHSGILLNGISVWAQKKGENN